MLPAKLALSLLLILLAAAPLLRHIRLKKHAATTSRGTPPEIDLFSPAIAFPLAYACIYSLGSLELLPESLPIPTSQFLYYFWGLGAYFLGIFLGRMYRPRTSIQRNNGYQLEYPLLLLGTVVLLLFSAVVFLKAGIPLLATDVETSRTLMVKRAGGWLYYMYKTLPLFTVLLVVHTWKSHSVPRKTYLSNYLILVGLAVVVLGAYRGPLVTVFLLLLITRHYLVRPVSGRALVITGAVAFFLYALLGALRAASGSLQSGAIFYKLLVEISNPANALCIIVENVPSRFPFFHGNLLLNAFYSILPGEQPAYGLILKDMFDMYFTGGGFTPSLLGGLYLDFGLSGIVIAMCLLGLLLQYLYSRMKAEFTPYNVVIYAFVLQYVIICIRGGLLQEILPIWFFLVLSFLRILTEKKQSRFIRSTRHG